MIICRDVAYLRPTSLKSPLYQQEIRFKNRHIRTFPYFNSFQRWGEGGGSHGIMMDTAT